MNFNTLTTKRKTACFTGHRPEKFSFGFDENSELFKDLLLLIRQEIELSILSGIDTFITGMSQGIDIWAAEQFLKLRDNNRLRLFCAVPYLGQNNCLNGVNAERYKNIINMSDETIVLSEQYTRESLLFRNRFMVDLSCLVIAFTNGSSGGTQYTIKYAQKNGILVHIVDVD